LDCYTLALQQSETLAIKQETIKEAEGRFLQALSTALPHAAFVSKHTRQDGADDQATEHKFTLQQPLFTGFKEFAAISGSKAEKRQRQQERIRAEQLLFVDVADAFYLLLSAEENLAALEGSRQALLDRTGELKKREQLGRSRMSELASTEARLNRLEADIEFSKNLQDTTKALLEFLTGKKITRIHDVSPELTFATSLDGYLAKVDLRPDLQAAQENLTISKKLVTVARSGFWPAVGLSANSYTKPIGSNKDVDWDALVTVTMPIFQGGQNLGNLKVAQSQERQTALTVSRLKRSALLEIQQAYSDYDTSLRRKAALTKALAAAERNYALQKEDYARNLVNNLDVLTALEDLQSSRRALITTTNETRRSYWRLKLSTGDITP